MRLREAKTLLRYDPDHGLIELEQKLPVPWLQLDQWPDWRQLPELRQIRSLLAYARRFTNGGAVGAGPSFWNIRKIFTNLKEKHGKTR